MNVIVAVSPAFRLPTLLVTAIVGGVVSGTSSFKIVPVAKAPPLFGTFAEVVRTCVHRLKVSSLSMDKSPTILTRSLTEVDPVGIVTPPLAVDQLLPSALCSIVELA